MFFFVVQYNKIYIVVIKKNSENHFYIFFAFL